jgi:hypothetical protein
MALGQDPPPLLGLQGVDSEDRIRFVHVHMLPHTGDSGLRLINGGAVVAQE